MDFTPLKMQYSWVKSHILLNLTGLWPISLSRIVLDLSSLLWVCYAYYWPHYWVLWVLLERDLWGLGLWVKVLDQWHVSLVTDQTCAMGT